MGGGGGWNQYSVCPRPFKRPREARRVRDWYGTGKGWAGKGRVRGGGLRDGSGRCKEQVRELYRLLKSFLVGGGGGG